jgi:hypothetical protein
MARCTDDKCPCVEHLDRVGYLWGRGQGSLLCSTSRSGFGRVGCGVGNCAGLTGGGPFGLTVGF